jgi:hypothetical protein
VYLSAVVLSNHFHRYDNEVARSIDKMEEAYEIKKLIELKMNEEAILKNYISYRLLKATL